MNKLIVTSVVFVWAFLALSCSRIELDEEENVAQTQSSTSSSKQPKTTLKVKFLASETEEGETTAISYPVNVYVFNAQGECVSLQVLTSISSSLSVKLPVGTYDIYAIGGADEAVYELPTKENATKESVLVLRSDRHNDLMTATSSVTLVDGETQNLVLELTRRVMMLQHISINNVPSEITAVSVVLSSLYQTVSLQGDVTGEVPFECVLQNEEGTATWKNTESIFLLPATVSPMQLKIVFTLSDGEKESFVYNATNQFVANYKININATYSSQEGLLEGILRGTSWDGEKNIEFTFNSSGSGSGGGNTGENPEVVNGDVPVAGTMYNDDYVMSVTSYSANSSTVVLMSGMDNEGAIGVDHISDKDYILSQLQSICSTAYTGWRLPTYTEALYIKNHVGELNRVINEKPSNTKRAINGQKNKYLLFADENGDLSALSFDESNDAIYAGQELDRIVLINSYLRGIVSVTFNK